MKNMWVAAGFVFALLSSSVAFADGPATLPDGPVAGPPGYTCTALGGRVTCVKTQQR